MAVVVASEDADTFISLAEAENLEAYVVATVNDSNRLVMEYHGEVVVDLARDFIDTSGARQNADVDISTLSGKNPFRSDLECNEENIYQILSDMNVASQKGLVEMFDASIGSTTVLMPFGGKTQLTPAQASVQKLPVRDGKTKTCSILTYGFDPEVMEYSCFVGAQNSVLQSMAKIIAVGGKPVSSPIKGSEQHHVISYVQALENESLIGDSPLIIGGGTIGAELALELAELKGKHPAIVELTDTLASQGNMLYRIALRQKYESLKEPIQIHYQTKCIEIKNDEAVLQHQDGSLETIKADTVIMCVGVKSDRSLVESFYDITPEIYEAGDAVRTRKIQEAVFEGYGIGAII